MARQRLLVTGAGGLVGSVLWAGLGDGYDLSGIDLRRVPDPRVQRGSTASLRRAVKAFEGMDAVVDLAATPAVSTPWEEVYGNNVPASWNALEAARQAGVRRVVVASSNNVTAGYERDEPYASVVAGHYRGLAPGGFRRLTTADPVRPNGAYAVGKALTEAAARYYADTFGLSVICLRIGTVNRDDQPSNARHHATWLSHRDLVQLVDRCLRAPADLGFAVFYGVSDNTWRIWDITDAQESVGYAPRDDAERVRG